MFADLNVALSNALNTVKTSFENFTVLQDTATAAEAAKEKGRNDLAKMLVDVAATVAKMQEEVGPVVPDPAPSIT